MVDPDKSTSFSFKGWNLWEYIKGRKKPAVMFVAGLLGYAISDQGLVALLSGGLVEMVWSVGEYYLKNI